MSSGDGIVYLVGAGPGDPGLATVRAIELIARADVIFYDRLVAPQLLRGARADAELTYVGKEPGGHTMSQEEINWLLVTHARNGRAVVRLKGGDPFVFGRGGEEAEALVQADVRFEVVPGVTAGVAAPAYAGIPVTHRDQSSAVAFVTAHEDPAKPESAIDWARLAAFPGTLVFYMGVGSLPALTRELQQHGRDPDEPAAVVERGTLPRQRVLTGRLADIAARAGGAAIRPPALTVVGSVAALRERLAWFERAPLRGRRIAVTRARAQASGLAASLEHLGAEVVEVPSIRIEPRLDSPEVQRAARRLAAKEFELLCLTSPNGAAVLLDAIKREGLDARALGGVTVAAIGPGTAAALREGGVAADVIPERSIAESLAAELVARGVRGKHVLVARAAEARDVLPDQLREAGAQVDVLALYDTVREPMEMTSLEALAGADYITFTSSSTVRFLLESVGGAERFPRGPRVVSIGPVTSETAREHGLKVDVEAERHDIDGLVEALLADALSPAAT
jgi:uroporphyrinogen III methyltransferase/synthase